MAGQKTIRRAVGVEGIGIHSGTHARLQLRPAPVGSGISFVRTDLGTAIPARAENTRKLSYSTSLGVRGAEVSTVEHLLSALAGLGVTNVQIDLDGPEVPILDGSAQPFVELLHQAGVVEQGVSLPEIHLHEPVRVEDGDRWIELRPAPELSVDYRVRYDSAVIGRQRFVGAMTARRFATGIAPARTFGFLHEVTAMRAAGLARGGSLDNCIVVDGERVISGELRFADEFVRHKVLDLIGDLALLEYPLRAQVVANRAGHALHVGVVHELLVHPERWELVEPDRSTPFTVHPYAGEFEAAVALAG
jgi:UDP-3-O-[3-hydroxymyristoyl] N-acetylglucosamine deacetylase